MNPCRTVCFCLSLPLLAVSPLRAATTLSITSPNNNASFTAAPTLAILAGVTNTGGSITKVEFYQGATKLGQSASTGSPYSFLWSNVPAGSYVLTTVATDNLGATT